MVSDLKSFIAVLHDYWLLQSFFRPYNSYSWSPLSSKKKNTMFCLKAKVEIDVDIEIVC